MSVYLSIIDDPFTPFKSTPSLFMTYGRLIEKEEYQTTNRFNWVEIRVRDLKKAKNFYGNLFGLYEYAKK